MNEIVYPTVRNLDYIYFRVERNNKFYTLSFTDLTHSEATSILFKKGIAFTGSLIKYLKPLLDELVCYVEENFEEITDGAIIRCKNTIDDLLEKNWDDIQEHPKQIEFQVLFHIAMMYKITINLIGEKYDLKRI